MLKKSQKGHNKDVKYLNWLTQSWWNLDKNAGNPQKLSKKSGITYVNYYSAEIILYRPYWQFSIHVTFANRISEAVQYIIAIMMGCFLIGEMNSCFSRRDPLYAYNAAVSHYEGIWLLETKFVQMKKICIQVFIPRFIIPYL